MTEDRVRPGQATDEGDHADEGYRGVEERPGAERRRVVGALEGRSNKLDWTSDSATDNRLRRDWVVLGEPGTRLTIDVVAERAGTLHLALVLE